MQVAIPRPHPQTASRQTHHLEIKTMSMDARREPMINAPLIVVLTIGLFVAVHLFVLSTNPDMDARWLLSLAFIPARYDTIEGAALPGAPWSAYTSVITHMFVHADWLHLGINSAWMLAFGAIIARRMSALRFIGFWLLCGLGGAGLFYVVNAMAFAPMVGASGAVSGLMGGVFRFLFHAGQYGGFAGAHASPRNVPLMPLPEALRNGRVLFALGIWIGINLLFATDLASVIAEGQIAWEAHLGGFLVGFLFIGPFDQVPPRKPDFVWVEDPEPDNDPRGPWSSRPPGSDDQFRH
jgi:membrane associated rhomboid family serine protease